jgi:hypothetical protein
VFTMHDFHMAVSAEISNSHINLDFLGFTRLLRVAVHLLISDT